MIGGLALAAGIKGYMFRNTFVFERILLLVAGVILIDTTLLTNIIGLATVALVVGTQLLMKKPENTLVISHEKIMKLGDER